MSESPLQLAPPQSSERLGDEAQPRKSRGHRPLSMREIQNSPGRLERFAGESLLTFQDAAEFLAMSESSLCYLHARGRGPNFVRIGKLLRFRRADLERFVAQRLHLGGGGKS